MSNSSLTRADYTGGKSTLCTGCGHDQITQNIISAFFELGIDPYDVIKTSGIGCSSKLPGYFMSKSQGINSMHGRMAPIATGAHVANTNPIYIGISGDGDSASIGLGGFAHLIRRNIKMIYIVANNGVYGLTKGQFSPTADKKSILKSGRKNFYEGIDICSFALEMGCDFVARTGSSNTKLTVNILKQAIQHAGTAIIDIVSPCITFNNHEGSTKSYDYLKEQNLPLEEVIHSLPAYDAKDKRLAVRLLAEAKEKEKILTGLLYRNENSEPFHQHTNLTATPLRELNEQQLRPSITDLQKLIQSFT